MLRAVRLVACTVALLGSACQAPPRPSLLPGAGADPVGRLQRDIDALLSTPGLERSIWGIVVRSAAEDDELLYALNPGTLLMPASAMKILTLAAAADRLGWDHTYETTMLGVGAIDVGRLDGDLVVVGTGDPSFDDWDGAATMLFGRWAERLKGLGIRTVAGRIIGDDNAFDDEPLGMGWTWEDLGASYSASVGALQINQNSARVSITPAADVGGAATVSIDPAWSGLLLDPAVLTASADVTASLEIRRLPGSPRLAVRGSVPQGGGRLFRTVSVDNPTLYFAQALRAALIGQGIDVRGSAVDIDALANPPARDEGVSLVTHRSPPLRDLAVTLMKSSQNMYAETLLKTTGTGSGEPASTAAGRRMVSLLLERWGIPADGVQMTDGSGLSRYNLATADALASILLRVHQSEYLRDPFRASLAIAGRDGTLARRMVGTIAQDNVFGKTGSFSNARSIAGYALTRDGEPLVFALLANNFGQAGDLVESTLDAVVVSLAQFSRR